MPGPASDLDHALSDVTFVVLDLETTGGSPSGCSITEIGALKLLGGECVGTFETHVASPYASGPDVAPPIEAALPALLEFVGGAVVVGHNIAFDVAFLQANLARLGYPPLANLTVDTYRMARRLVRDDVDDLRLGTLARHFGTEATPCHRAFADAAATAELFHRLLEQVASLGVVALDDLLALPAAAGHPQVHKLRWVAPLPRRPGAYLFRGAGGEALFAGGAAELRSAVRSLFCSTDRRIVGPMLREAQSLEHLVCAHGLEAAVVAGRLIDRHAPRYNPEVKQRRSARYVTMRGGRARVQRTPPAADPASGPWSSPATAKVAAALHEAGLDPLTHEPLAGDREAAVAFGDARDHLRRVDALVAGGELELTFDGGAANVSAGRLVTPFADGSGLDAAGSSLAHTWGVADGTVADANWIVRWIAAHGAGARTGAGTAA